MKFEDIRSVSELVYEYERYVVGFTLKNGRFIDMWSSFNSDSNDNTIEGMTYLPLMYKTGCYLVPFYDNIPLINITGLDRIWREDKEAVDYINNVINNILSVCKPEELQLLPKYSIIFQIKQPVRYKDGDIELINGDCMQAVKEIPDNSVDLIVADPPYLIPTIKGGGSVKRITGLNGAMQELEDVNLTKGYNIAETAFEFVRVMKNVNIYYWCNKLQIPEYIDLYVNQLKCKFDLLCWHKTNVPPTYSNKYLPDTEYLLYFHKGKGKGRCFPQSYEDAQTYYISSLNTIDKDKYNHPTVKPLDFTEKIIRNSSKEGDIILDPYMGSGTTGAACRNLKRGFIGIEINEDYYDTAFRRIFKDNI